MRSEPRVTEADPLTDVASALPVFGGHLRRFRLQRGFTQEELAEHADVSRATIASLEQGHAESAPCTNCGGTGRCPSAWPRRPGGIHAAGKRRRSPPPQRGG